MSHFAQCSLRLPKMPIEKLTPLHPYPTSSSMSPSYRRDRRYTGRGGRALSSQVAIVFSILSTYVLIPLAHPVPNQRVAAPRYRSRSPLRDPAHRIQRRRTRRIAGALEMPLNARWRGQKGNGERERVRKNTDHGRRHVRRTLPPHTVSWSGCSASNSAPDSGSGGNAAEPWNPTPGFASRFEV